MHRRHTAWYGVLPIALAGLVAACGDGGSNPPAAACTASNSLPVSLSPGQYIAVDPTTTEGCVAFAANAGGTGFEYLVVPQSATGVAGRKTSFRLGGENAAAAISAHRVAGEPGLTAPDRFHDFLRQTERRPDWGGLAPATGPRSG